MHATASRYQRRKAAASTGDVRLLMERPIWISGHVRMDAPRMDRSQRSRAEAQVHAHRKDVHVVTDTERERVRQRWHCRGEIGGRGAEAQIIVLGEDRHAIVESPFESCAGSPARAVEPYAGDRSRGCRHAQHADGCRPGRGKAQGEFVLHPGSATLDVEQPGRCHGHASTRCERCEPGDRWTAGEEPSGLIDGAVHVGAIEHATDAEYEPVDLIVAAELPAARKSRNCLRAEITVDQGHPGYSRNHALGGLGMRMPPTPPTFPPM